MKPRNNLIDTATSEATIVEVAANAAGGSPLAQAHKEPPHVDVLKRPIQMSIFDYAAEIGRQWLPAADDRSAPMPRRRRKAQAPA
ncbi:hypothetical protein [Polymorphobacter megasporae]|uniref:hypothetical protein n=1 Tax=Glacieibacterium megasporae TaxID=2835787 RepID=UPI001C1E7FF2|nr:hypothetical protein [Polymorphobacter megasporae]UAJ10045.1 hypothetical protein KTC28_17500 [Polymorphobacter megasporae]